MIDDQKVIYLSFCIKFFKQRVNIAFQCALTSLVKRKIAWASDVCFRPLITIKCHNLHACDIRGAMGETTSYHKRDFYFIFWFMWVVRLLACLFCLPFDGFDHRFFILFFIHNCLSLTFPPYIPMIQVTYLHT